jgi:hypothetical protein
VFGLGGQGLFNLYWRWIIPLGQNSSNAFPFSRLDREPLWALVPQPGTTITPAIINNTSSVTYLRKYALGAKLGEGVGGTAVLTLLTQRGILLATLRISCIYMLLPVIQLMDLTKMRCSMIDRNNPLIREAASLPPLDKLQLVDYLLESLDMPDTEIEKLWAEESSRRWEGYKAGEIGSVSAAEVFEKYKP